MAKRPRDVYGLPESRMLWNAGRGLIVRDLPWTQKNCVSAPMDFHGQIIAR